MWRVILYASGQNRKNREGKGVKAVSFTSSHAICIKEGKRKQNSENTETPLRSRTSTITPVTFTSMFNWGSSCPARCFAKVLWCKRETRVQPSRAVLTAERQQVVKSRLGNCHFLLFHTCFALYALPERVGQKNF